MNHDTAYNIRTTVIAKTRAVENVEAMPQVDNSRGWTNCKRRSERWDGLKVPTSTDCDGFYHFPSWTIWGCPVLYHIYCFLGYYWEWCNENGAKSSWWCIGRASSNSGGLDLMNTWTVQLKNGLSSWIFTFALDCEGTKELKPTKFDRTL